MVAFSTTTGGRDPYSTANDTTAVIYLVPTMFYIEVPFRYDTDEVKDAAALWQQFFMESFLVKLFIFIAWWEERLRHFLRGLFNIFRAVLFRRAPLSKSGFLARAGKRKKGKR